MLIDPDRILVECYRRNERDNWELVTTMGEVSGAAAEDSLMLDSVDMEIALPQVYEDVVFPDGDEVLHSNPN
ncbi:hypothetical protein IQ254_11720 [Nodosilinea sp. LEGE 07088]|uniref:hypothetical protein n=1 Tax=Nodosilinea sp. LEGE 07088 TaxID=2777968 RepID=UPI00187EDF39|nr:hypothetical protein [Nodosilinea sp. LEGE 07088]MBE9137853.1 hypothetical protein [Nodosilinea sp. LEGE 07088]